MAKPKTSNPKGKKSNLSDPHNAPTASEEALVEAAKTPPSQVGQYGDR